MIRKKNNVMISIVSGLDDVQAANLQRDITLAKKKNAPGCRATMGVVDLNEVKDFLQTNIPLMLESKNEE